MNIRGQLFRFGIVAILILLLQHTVGAETQLSVHVNPSRIAMGTTYNGCEVFVSGLLPKDAEILIRVRGKQGEAHFKKKGKALGLLWMNMGTVEMDHVPVMMLLAPSDELARMMEKQGDSWRSLGLGFDALKQEIAIAPDSEDKDMIIGELLKLKQREGLYDIQKSAIRYEEQGVDKAFHAVIHFPSALTPAAYSLETFAIRDGNVIARDSRTIEAKMVGWPAFLAGLAFQHGLLYGILAVLVALAAGLFIGYIFRGDSGGH